MATLCRNCALQVMKGRWLRSRGESFLPQQSLQPRRRYHHIRLETISEVWQKIKEEFTILRKASANRLPQSTDLAQGFEIGIAKFLLRMDAKVHFSNGKWYGKVDGKRMVWPGKEAIEFAVNAIDARGVLLDQYGIQEVVKLKQVKFLNLEGCLHINDVCLASLVHLRDTLTHLNINNCPSVTENGIATLHKLRKLERLNMTDIPMVKHPKLVASLLEDAVPNLRVNIISHMAEQERQRTERHQAQ